MPPMGGRLVSQRHNVWTPDDRVAQLCRGGLQQQKTTFQVCADNRRQTTDMT